MRTDVTDGRRPEYTAVYLAEDPELGYFAGYKPMWPGTPMWCAGAAGAMKFDEHVDHGALDHAKAVCRKHTKGGKVWCHPRYEIYPEQYNMKGNGK